MDLACELQKLPELFNHYQEHKAYNNSSFFEYLVDDYISIDSDSSLPIHDDTNHDDSPFHGNHHCCHTTVYCESVDLSSLATRDFAKQSEFAYYKTHHTSEFLDYPFQPPQV